MADEIQAIMQAEESDERMERAALQMQRVASHNHLEKRLRDRNVSHHQKHEKQEKQVKIKVNNQQQQEHQQPSKLNNTAVLDSITDDTIDMTNMTDEDIAASLIANEQKDEEREREHLARQRTTSHNHLEARLAARKHAHENKIGVESEKNQDQIITNIGDKDQEEKPRHSIKAQDQEAAVKEDDEGRRIQQWDYSDATVELLPLPLRPSISMTKVTPVTASDNINEDYSKLTMAEKWELEERKREAKAQQALETLKSQTNSGGRSSTIKYLVLAMIVAAVLVAVIFLVLANMKAQSI